MFIELPIHDANKKVQNAHIRMESINIIKFHSDNSVYMIIGDNSFFTPILSIGKINLIKDCLEIRY